nr:thioesterase family protein [Luteipulveratus halotolerans]
MERATAASLCRATSTRRSTCSTPSTPAGRCSRQPAAGIRQHAMQAAGIGPVVLETTIRYRRELLAGDEVTVLCAFESSGAKTFRVHQQIVRADGVLAAEVEAVGGVLDLTARTLVADPAEAMRALASDPDLLGF